MSKFNELNSRNSTILEWEGVELRTIQNPYLNDDTYKATAIDHNDDEYEIVWEINHPDFDSLEDESEACDWDSPSSVEKL